MLICLVGPFGSGCSTIARFICEKPDFYCISLSGILKETVLKKYGVKDLSRSELQDYGNRLREEEGSEILSKLASNMIAEKGGLMNYVIDSIRNPHEIEYLKSIYPNTFVFGITADRDKRWERSKIKYNNLPTRFDEDEKRDSKESFEYGQRVTDCFLKADVIIENNEALYADNQAETALKLIINKYINIINKATIFCPTDVERYMTIAYACCLSSSCLQRKVGAVIISSWGSIISSGYNEVPPLDSSCRLKYGVCYRKHLRGELEKDIGPLIKDEAEKEQVFLTLKNRVKILEKCRALHAEENAILSLIKSGASIKGATLYTTTYPCNLCANKIAAVGIEKIVYFEPYPIAEAYDILKKGNVNQEHFTGATFNGYFKFMEVPV